MSKSLPGYIRYSISFEQEEEGDVIKLLDNMGNLRTRIIKYMLKELIIKPYGAELRGEELFSVIGRYVGKAQEIIQITENGDRSTMERYLSQITVKAENIFEPPTIEDVERYIRENQLSVDADQFFYHYAANGWIQKEGVPVKDWKCQLMKWNANCKSGNAYKSKKEPAKFNQYDQRNLDYDGLIERMNQVEEKNK